MTVAYHTGMNPGVVREEWLWRDVEEFLYCLPMARRVGHPLYAEDPDGV